MNIFMLKFVEIHEIHMGTLQVLLGKQVVLNGKNV